MADAKLVKPEKLPDTNFQQQNLKAWQPVLTSKWVIIYFVVMGLILIPLGIIVLAVTAPVVHTEARYDNLARDSSNNTMVSILIESDMNSPVYFYYKMTNYYQNHRLYVKSRDSNQLKGLVVAPTDLDTKCDPLSREEQTDKLLYPCGLIAHSYFTDTFSSPTVGDSSGNQSVQWTGQGISWKADKGKFLPFTNYNPSTMSNKDFFTGQPLNHTTEDFEVWMRTSGLPTFMKLRYIINSPLKAGQTLSFTVNNNYDVWSFGGEKWVVISTMSGLGGRNPFLGYFAIALGILCFVMALGSAVLVFTKPRKLGDLSYCEGREA